MDQFFKILGGLGFLLTIASLFVAWMLSRNLNKVANRATEELKAIILDPQSSIFYIMRALDTLKERHVDISFAKPPLAQLMLSEARKTRMYADMTARADFPDLIEFCDYKWWSPSAYAKAQLRSVIDGGPLR